MLDKIMKYDTSYGCYVSFVIGLLAGFEEAPNEPKVKNVRYLKSQVAVASLFSGDKS